MKKQISNPAIGSVVKHTGWRFENDKNYPCDVYIVSGAYMINNRLSNFWNWRRVLKNGKLSKKIESGYGSFEQTSNKYSIDIKLERL